MMSVTRLTNSGTVANGVEDCPTGGFLPTVYLHRSGKPLKVIHGYRKFKYSEAVGDSLKLAYNVPGIDRPEEPAEECEV